MRSERVLTTVDSHTAGHPTRVVTGGIPPLEGVGVRERRDYFRAEHDALRTFLLHEPRGHAAMVGAVLTESSRADFGVFYLGSYGYLDMCGHATLGLARTLDYLGLLRPTDGHARFTLEVPAGIVTVRMDYDGDAPTSIDFDNVPAYVARLDETIEADGLTVACDIVYGGNWYALVPAAAADVDLAPLGVGHAMAVGSRLKDALNARIRTGALGATVEPVDSILFYGETSQAGTLVSRHLVILASNKFDRSPCGTGTSARLAQLLQRGRIEPDQAIVAESILGTRFVARAGRLDGNRIQPSIKGLAHITGQHSFILESGDPLPHGFLCR
jgi:proline racemase